DSQPIEQSKASSANTYSLLGIEWNIWRDIELGGGCGVSGRHKKPTNPNDHRGVLTTLSVSSPRSWIRNFGALWRSTWYWLRSSENNAQIYPHSDSKTSLNFFADSPVTISEKKLEQSRVKFARLTYTPICTGCSKCWEKKLMSNFKLLLNVCQNGYYSTNFFEITIFIFDGQSYKESGLEVNTKKSSSLLGRIFGFSLSSNNNKSNIDEVKSIEIQQEIKAKSSIDNPACGELKELIVEKASGFTITPEGDHIRLDILRCSTSYWDHIQQFRSWLLSQPYSFKSGSQVILCDKLRLFPGQTENEFYWIDNDYFEAHPIEVDLRRNAINLFM
ncbi:unnamed protein product, partial [Schistosoma curassoni]|uniref:Fibrinogen C-terminal domain-containing protein n=1 Tax=Schistosoma curassoni TaxID=6186 RepID=A0A183KDY5_9TREM